MILSLFFKKKHILSVFFCCLFLFFIFLVIFVVFKIHINRTVIKNKYLNVIQSIDYTVAKNYTSDTFSLKNYVESNPESYILFQISIDMEYFDYFLVKDIHDQFLGEKIKAIYILRTREEEIKEAQLKLIKKSGNESFTVLIATDKELEKLMNTLYPNEILYPLQFIVNNNNHTIIKIQMVSEEDMLNEVYRYMNSDSHFEW